MTDKFPILAFFKFDHLPAKLQEISKPFNDLAFACAERETLHPAELAAGLRKLLEAKDCIVRCALPKDATPIPRDAVKST